MNNTNTFGVGEFNFYVSGVVNGVERVFVTNLDELESL